MRLVSLLLVGIVATLMFTSIWSAAVAADPSGQIDMKQARRQATGRRRRIIYNDDGLYCAGQRGEPLKPYGTREELYKVRHRQIVNTQVDTIFYCSGETTIFAHESRVGDNYATVIPPNLENPTARNVRMGILGLRRAGYDTLGLNVEFCRQSRMEVFWSLRMNDIHGSLPYSSFGWELSRWKMDHPEYLMGTADDWHNYPQSSPRAWWSALDYEIPQVRDYIFRVVEDVLQRYDVDGLELDWMRSPMFFRPTLDMKPVESRHVAIMNKFVRRLRALTEQSAQQRGRPVPIACRVPMSVERSRFVGLDVETWLTEDLVDILILGQGTGPLAMAPQIREMVKFAHQFEKPAYACINNSNLRQWDYSVEAYRGAAMNIWYAGADGVYTFNYYPSQPSALLDQMGSPATLKGLDKVYGIDCVVADEHEGDIRPGLVLPRRLPIRLTPGIWAQAHLVVGEDIVAHAPEGRTCHAQLRLRVSGFAQGDEVSVRLDGEIVGAATPTRAPSAEPAEVWLELNSDPKLIQEGDNLVELKLSGRGANDNDEAVLDRLDLVVRYE